MRVCLFLFARKREEGTAEEDRVMYFGGSLPKVYNVFFDVLRG